MQRFALVMAAALLGACSAQEAAVPLDSEPLNGGALTSGDRAALHALDTPGAHLSAAAAGGGSRRRPTSLGAAAAAAPRGTPRGAARRFERGDGCDALLAGGYEPQRGGAPF